jgi:hypothetical protein
MRKKFNFMIGRGNLFLLPIQANGRDLEPVQCSTKLSKLIEKFANPEEYELQKGYQTLLNSLPPPEYAKVVSAERWFEATWKPDIVIKDLDQSELLLARLEEEERKKKEEADRKAAEEAENEWVVGGDKGVDVKEGGKEKGDKDAGKETGKDKGDKKSGEEDGEKKKKKKKKEPELTAEEKRTKAADDSAAALMAEMNESSSGAKSRGAAREAALSTLTVTQRAAKMTFSTSALRSMVSVADKRAEEEAAEAAAKAAKSKRF